MKNNETEKYFGTCRFCGQTELILADTPEEADEAAMRDCKCAGAFDFRQKQNQKEKGKSALRALFVAKSDRWNCMENDSLLVFLDMAIDKVVDEEIDSISFRIPGVGSGKISNSTKGVVVSRTKSVSGKITADK